MFKHPLQAFRQPLLRRVCGAALAIAVSGAVFAGSANQLKQFGVDGKPLSAQPANASRIEPLIDGLFAYDQALQANGGVAPKDAGERLKALRGQSAAAVNEISALAKRLKSNGETEAFNRYIAGRVVEMKSTALSSELKAANGDAYAMLLKAGSVIDQELASREQGVVLLPSDRLFALLGIGRAEAGLKSTVCGFGIFVVTLGYGERFAYVACYR